MLYVALADFHRLPPRPEAIFKVPDFEVILKKCLLRSETHCNYLSLGCFSATCSAKPRTIEQIVAQKGITVYYYHMNTNHL